MKKNLMTVVVLALVLVNLILTAILTITILPETKKANELITQVCGAISLELNSGAVTEDSLMTVPIDQLASYDVAAGEDMTVNLKDSGDGKNHYATIRVMLSMDTENEGYKKYSEELAERVSMQCRMRFFPRCARCLIQILLSAWSSLRSQASRGYQ